jgi:endonuclease/exonuclease/phosphatase family metal-dependent hydrolase
MSTYLSPANVMELVQRDDGRVLAVRHNETSKTSPNQVTVVGGKLEHGEFVHEGALRELTEETSVHVAAEDLEFCQLVHYLDADGERGSAWSSWRSGGRAKRATPNPTNTSRSCGSIPEIRPPTATPTPGRSWPTSPPAGCTAPLTCGDRRCGMTRPTVPTQGSGPDSALSDRQESEGRGIRMLEVAMLVGEDPQHGVDLLDRSGRTAVTTIRVVTFNTLFGGHDDFGLGAGDRWQGQVAFLKALEADILALQECNFWDLLGNRRMYQTANALGMNTACLAYANETTSGHRFHTVIMLSRRVLLGAQGTDRDRYHHVMGWANLVVPGLEGLLELRNLHLDPFDPRNRAREVSPLGVLAAPGRRSLVVGDVNSIGVGYPEPDWTQLPTHVRNGQLLLPRQGDVSDRDATELLSRAGFLDASHRFKQEMAPTAAFGEGDVPRRQDLILMSPALAPALVGYQVHLEPVDKELSDHGAVCADFDFSLVA